ncbi:hypothetical protein M408DRAFT_30751 [Serendipita vermifera MAFF 305830]|uniref:Retrovirus-related Pol polyprotein from transposon TNT 1-94-like beta-barrel domain-containing protein n=1 Tax=Serendipita vermifera MAFF 305830 TaxID=933852 RepID=A0A0C2W0D8_SERVB|nr:hypothetical protein M408DRAFT_30751 [Serendipita vermifera MAFF 305830]
MATTKESGLLAVTSPFDIAFDARSGPSSSAPALLSSPLANALHWPGSQHMVSKSSNNNKHPSKPKQQSAAKPAVEEFAGKANSGATSSMTSHKEWLVDYTPLKVSIHLVDDSVVYSAGIGKVWFEPVLDGYHAPLVSFIDTRVTFEKHGAIIFDATINSSKVGKLNGHTLPAIHVPPQQQALTAGLYPHDLYPWHCRFGHRRIAAVERAIKHSLLGVQLDASTSSPSICVPCVAGKQHTGPFPVVRAQGHSPYGDHLL